MSRGPIDRRGRLQDFIARPGDPPVTIPGRADSKQQKWGGRFLISDQTALNNIGVPRAVTVLATGDLQLPTPINVQLRFAANNPINNQPILPFTYDAHGGISRVTAELRRGTDPSASPTIDTFNMFVNDVLPIDTVTARELGMRVFVDGFGSGSTTWVEAIASPVTDVGPKNHVYPWNEPGNPRFVALNVAATTLLEPNSDRIQFFIVNTSPDADLLIQFGRGPNLALPQWLPNPLGTFILPRGGFSVYESPAPFSFKGVTADGVRGAIYGIWSNAGTGGAMIHEGTVY